MTAQKALAAIDNYERGQSHELVDILQSPDTARAIGAFERPISNEALLRLMADTAMRASRQTFQEWSDSAPPGLIAVWGMMLDKPPDASSLERSISTILPTVTSQNLSVAHTLVRSFGSQAAEVRHLLDEEQLLRLKTVLLNSLKSLSSAAALTQSLAGSHPCALLSTSWMGQRREQDGGQDMPFDGWDSLAEVLLLAARSSPAVILPQIVPFVVSEVSRFENEGEGRLTRVQVFDEERARKLFRYEQLQTIVLANAPGDWMRAAVRDGYSELYRRMQAGTDPLTA